MKFNLAQTIIYNQKHPKEITLKSRQQGISTYKTEEALDACIFVPNHQAGIQSYGKVEAQKLYRKAITSWERLHPLVKKMLKVDIASASAQTGVTFTNGSSLRIGNFRGDTLQRLHVSELAKIAKIYPEKALELKTGAFQAVAKGNEISIESTAEGQTGMFYEIWETAKSRYDITLATGKPLTTLDFKPVFLSWVIDPDCTLDEFYEPSQEALDYVDEVEKYFNDFDDILGKFINRQYLLYPILDEWGNNLRMAYNPQNFVEQRPLDIFKEGTFKLTQAQKNWVAGKLNELSDYMNQEYPYSPDSAFNLPLHGTFFKSQYSLLQNEKWRLKPQPYDPAYPIYVSFDIGAKDYTVLYFAQVKPLKHPDGVTRLTPVLLFEYESNDTLGIEHYIDIIYRAKCPHSGKQFFPNYKAIILPHDGNKTEWTTGRTAFEILASYGLPVVTLPELLRFSDSIQVARDFMNIAIFSGVPNLLVGLQNYRRRYDKQLQVYLDTDVHDINSDRAASFRYMAQYLFFDTHIEHRNFVSVKR